MLYFLYYTQSKQVLYNNNYYIDDCSSFTDCYNCTANYYYYNKTKCQWKEGSCFATDKSHFNCFWEAFEECADDASNSIKEKYCGSGTFSGDKVKVVLPQVDGKTKIKKSN